MVSPAGAMGSVEQEAQAAPIHVMAYGPDLYEESSPATAEEARAAFSKLPVTWMNVNSTEDAVVLRHLEEKHGLHPLALEDVANPRQRPKVEDYGEYLFIVTQMPYLEDGELRSEQLSLFLGKNWVITVQQKPGDMFMPVRERIRQGRARIRTMGSDYLAYAILDAVVDSYFPLLEQLGSTIEDLEETALDPSTPSVTHEAITVKRQLLLLRRLAWPQREAVSFLERGDHPLLTRGVRPFFRDVYDHTVRVIDVVEVYRELAGDIQSLHLSVVNTRMNEIMKVLTIMASIFIPLTFITGVYGMNFDTGVSPLNMPELGWAFGYPAVLVVMATVAGSLLLFFRRRGWL